jgi:Ca2+-binding RTX toxin-like protein
MALVNFPDIPNYPDNLTSLTNNGYTALVALGPGTTILGSGEHWYGSYIRMVFGNDYATVSNTFINYGTIYNHGTGTISALGANAIGFEHNYGVIVAQSSDGPAYGSGSDSAFRGFSNAGEIYAFSGTTNATAFWSFDPLAFVYNSGLLAAHSDATEQGTGSADAIAQFNSGGLLNDRSGVLLAEGPYAHGILVGRGLLVPNSAFQIVNLGTITAQATRAGLPSYGISANGLDVEFMHVYNDGTITADIAYYIEVPYFNAGSNQVFINGTNGVLNGRVTLNAGNDLIVNSGTISGPVSLGPGANVYFGMFGRQDGEISGGAAATIVVGTAAGDTVAGGAGDDVIVGLGGADQLTGGGGSNRYVYLSITDSTSAAPDVISDFRSGSDVIDLSRLDLSGVTITASGGASTVHGIGATADFTIVVQGALSQSDIQLAGPLTGQAGSANNDLLVAPEGGGQLIGGAGNDVLIGSSGSDTLDGGLGNNVLVGGAGDDTAVFHSTFSNFMIEHDSDGSMFVTDRNLYGTGGTAIVYGVEHLQFEDRSFSVFGFAAADLRFANFNSANGWVTQDLYPRHVADINGDGYGDIVGFGAAGTWVSYGSAGGTFAAPNLVVTNFGQGGGWATDNQYHRELADVNGDGRADILGFGTAGTWVSLAIANGTFTAPAIGIAQFSTAQGWATQDGYARTTGDINGDGKADIVGFGQAGTWSSLSNGDGTFKPVQFALSSFGVAQGWTSDNAFHRTLADVNGDGKADLVGFGFAGTWVALSIGDGTFADPQVATANFGVLQGWSSNDSFPRLVADVNGDHVADVVGFGIAGTWVSIGEGDGTFTAPRLDTANFGANQGWTSDGIFHREVVDISHDGLADLVGFGIAGVFVAANQGDFLL